MQQEREVAESRWAEKHDHLCEVHRNRGDDPTPTERGCFGFQTRSIVGRPGYPVAEFAIDDGEMVCAQAPKATSSTKKVPSKMKRLLA